ncbi:trichome birefringence-like protein 6 [Tanacetum coccineum]|uniref:Trichome birefringence-like protein 6 n=1 Tax=Tanacetum coccineum TaxID=301880 RepID=A0ABQ5DRN4_9ASTR
MNWRWKPHDCDIPRFNATNMLELIRGKRLVFVDPWRVYETPGRRITKDKGNYSFKFLDDKCTVEYYVSHFLVHEGKDRVGRKRMQTLRIDTVDRGSSDGEELMVNYYQEADNVLPHLDSSTAFTKSMTTWASWVDKNINPRRTQVIFRSSAPSHFEGGEWNAGGHCKEATRPLNQTIITKNSPDKNLMLQRIIKQMITPVKFLNITILSDYRIDGHPSIYGRKKGSPLKGEYCSHWCLPGVPDVWKILYVHLQSNVKNRYIQ